MRTLGSGFFAVAALLLLSTPAFSQGVAGIVRDSSGAILPGVTVEAASPALIEKSRSVVTDGTGQYRIVDLEPGTYTVTFTLPGFATIRREGIELSGAGVTTINADMRVGAVQETVTVTGATPVVDTQTSTKREVVLADEVLASVPVTRTYGSVLAMVPGVQSLTLDVNSTQSVGGTATNFFFTSRGGRGNEGTVQVDGMNVGSAFGGGGVSSFAYDFVNAQEVQVTVAGGMGESDRGGPAFNIIPKTGGNTFNGTAFFSTAGEWSQGSNLDDDLRRVGITEPPGLIKNLRHEPRDWRSDQARSAVVLQQPAHLRYAPGRSGPVCQCERARSLEVELREGSKRESAVGRVQEDRIDPPDRPAYTEEQAGLLLGLPGELRRVGARQHGRCVS